MSSFLRVSASSLRARYTASLHAYAYVGCTHRDHPRASQFLICDDCGEVAEVEDASLAKSLKAAGEAIGFRTKRPIVEELGICAQCDAKRDV